MKNRQIRQGDVMAIAIDALPKGLKKKKDTVLVHSDSTMHDHTLVSGTVFTDKTGKMYASVPTETQIVHTADHDPVQIPAGVYEIRRQVEYDKNNMVKIVVD
jgi:hypothetical protein